MVKMEKRDKKQLVSCALEMLFVIFVLAVTVYLFSEITIIVEPIGTPDPGQGFFYFSPL